MSILPDFQLYLAELARRKAYLESQLQGYARLEDGRAGLGERMAYLKGEVTGLDQAIDILTDAQALVFSSSGAPSVLSLPDPSGLRSQILGLQSIPLDELAREIDRFKKLN